MSARTPAAQVLPSALPAHVAIIMDGNGRWASSQGLPREQGHRRGADAVRAVVRAAREIGIRALTLYAFSAQNWSRPGAEVGHLMDLLRTFLIDERAEILARGIRLVSIGDEARLPPLVRLPLRALVRASARNRGMTLCLALSYGGREAIVAAACKLARAVSDGRLRPEDITETLIDGTLDTRALPPVDLLIRTSGEQRLSNFLLWEGAYAELYFTPVLWPDFDRCELENALAAFARRERRYGRFVK
ncbi:MAG TPA: polyprenyl diphosphate synthase [Polyangia bacterium]|nr:polyprenyl diphosphate synthase [Polyangia bacterium]